jgi:hypothetical protein
MSTEKNVLVLIQNELKAPKNQYNNFGKYKYRNCEDILEAVKPILLNYNSTLTMTDDVIMIGNALTCKATATFECSEYSKSVNAYAGIDVNRKGMDIAQSFGASSSYARKYALNGLFLIDDNKDADATNTHGNDAKETKILYKYDVSSLMKSEDFLAWVDANALTLEEEMSHNGKIYTAIISKKPLARIERYEVK